MKLRRLFQWMFAAILTCSALSFMSCSNKDNPDSSQEYTGMPLVILDTDIGSSTDDLFALEMLYGYENQGRCRLLGVMDGHSPYQASVYDLRLRHGPAHVGRIADHPGCGG